MKRLFFTLLMGGLLLTQSQAQDGRNQINYGTLAQQFSTHNINGDAHSSVLPSVAIANGFGTYIDNPAATALIMDSYFTFGYFGNQATSDNQYLGNTSSIDGQLGRISNVGVIYSAPTTQGSLVFGGGYTLDNSVNRLNYLSAENTESTITDQFKNSSSQYYDIAYESFAIDYFDVEGTQIESIFRIGFEPGSFPGIYQDVDITHKSNTGEISLFAATEFQKNLFIGASFALVTGSHSYQRNFLETDKDYVYEGDFLFADENGQGGTDIHSILLKDNIDSEILGTDLRVGFLSKALPHVHVGASYLLPTKLYITESYSSSIRTTFDDGSNSDENSISGDFSYEIKKPAQLNLGLALVDVQGFTVSASTEFINYGSTEVILTSDPNLAFEDITALRDDENLINSGIESDYNWVTNIKAGASYAFMNGYELRAGGGWFPGRSSNYSADRWQLAGGLGIPLSREIFLDVSTQYMQWNDRSKVYEFYNDQIGATEVETVDESFSQINVLVGLKFRF